MLAVCFHSVEGGAVRFFFLGQEQQYLSLLWSFIALSCTASCKFKPCAHGVYAPGEGGSRDTHLLLRVSLHVNQPNICSKCHLSHVLRDSFLVGHHIFAVSEWEPPNEACLFPNPVICSVPRMAGWLAYDFPLLQHDSNECFVPTFKMMAACQAKMLLTLFVEIP